MEIGECPACDPDNLLQVQLLFRWYASQVAKQRTYSLTQPDGFVSQTRSHLSQKFLRLGAALCVYYRWYAPFEGTSDGFGRKRLSKCSAVWNPNRRAQSIQIVNSLHEITLGTRSDQIGDLMTKLGPIWSPNLVTHPIWSPNLVMCIFCPIRSPNLVIF